MTITSFTITEKVADNYLGTFCIEPLPQGYGDTLGNSLRRVLYSSIKGAAITSVSFTGINHQFTTLPGVEEDVVRIILNLKQVRVKYSGDKPVRISLSLKGSKTVTAADFELPPEVTIANPESVLAHLNDKSAKLSLEATVESGFGYSPAEDRKITTLGVIPIDATFTPVIKANYKVEATRVGRITNFDKLTLDITTDGTISPKNCLSLAAQTLVDYFSNIVNPAVSSPSASAPLGTKSSAGTAISVEELDLPTRIFNALQKAGFSTVADLLAVSRTELAKVKNLGGKSVKIIEEALSHHDFPLPNS